MMTTRCTCPFCLAPSVPMFKHSDGALLWLIEQRKDHLPDLRYRAYVELLYRSGVFDPLMPRLVWEIVMGPDIPFKYQYPIGRDGWAVH